MAQKYIKLDVIEAIEWTGHNQEELKKFIPKCQNPVFHPDDNIWLFFINGNSYQLNIGEYALRLKDNRVIVVTEKFLFENYTPIDSHLIEIKTGIAQAINDVVELEGEIESVSKIGNRLAIKFKNGNRYSQPLISKNTNIIHENA